jgi:hypothetical protein
MIETGSQSEIAPALDLPHPLVAHSAVLTYPTSDHANEFVCCYQSPKSDGDRPRRAFTELASIESLWILISTSYEHAAKDGRRNSRQTKSIPYQQTQSR